MSLPKWPTSQNSLAEALAAGVIRDSEFGSVNCPISHSTVKLQTGITEEVEKPYVLSAKFIVNTLLSCK